MAELGARLQALLDKDEITQVVQDLARGTDRLDGELIASCYHPDGFDDHNSFRGGPQEFAKWVLEVLPHFAATHHFLGQSRIELDGDRAYVETYCSAHHVAHPDAVGHLQDMRMGLRYCDRFERRDGTWLIAKRVCAFDWAYYVDSDRQWTFDPDFTVGSRSRDDITYTRF
jgi:SnoaL-like domain